MTKEGVVGDDKGGPADDWMSLCSVRSLTGPLFRAVCIFIPSLEKIFHLRRDGDSWLHINFCGGGCACVFLCGRQELWL